MAISVTLTIPVTGTDFYGAAADDGSGLPLRDGMVDVWTDLTALKTTLEAVDATTLDAFPALATHGTKFVKVNAGETAFEYVAGSTSAHAADHIQGGGDEVDADLLDIDYAEANYTPATTGVATDINHLAAHLEGIDDEFGLINGINTPAQTHYANLLTGTTPTAGGDVDLGGNDIRSTDVALEVDAFTTADRPHMRIRNLGTTSCGFGVNGSAGGNADFFVNGEGTGRLVAPGNWSGNALLAAERKSTRTTVANPYVVVENNTNSTRNLTDEGRVIIYRTAGGAVTLPLTPTAGFTVTIKNDAAGAVTINRSGLNTIEGATSKSLPARYDFTTLVFDGTDWYEIATNV